MIDKSAFKGCPATVDVLGYRWTISFDLVEFDHYRVEHDAINCKGVCRTWQHTILVDPDQAFEGIRETVFHELEHAVLNAQGGADKMAQNEESYVSALGAGMLAVLRKNPRLTRWLTAPVPTPKKRK